MEIEILEAIKQVQEQLNKSSFDLGGLASAVVGGIIALAGAFGVQYVQIRESRGLERLEERKRNISSLASLLNKYEDELQRDVSQVYGVMSPNDIDIPYVDSTFRELEINIYMGEKALVPQVRVLESVHFEYFDRKRSLLAAKQKIEGNIEELEKYFNEQFELCIKAKQALLSETFSIVEREIS